MRRLSIAGQWQCRLADTAEAFEASVPGGVYTDLLAADRIPDPYDRDNELALQWVGKSDWLYERTITVPAAFLEEDRIRLRCAGLDTVATVRVNGTVVGETENMHREYEFDVAAALQAGKNEIAITFHSPVEYSTRKAEESEYEVPALRYPVDQPGRNHIRKAACHYGWDWGPCLPTMGIWRDIELLGYSEPRIRYTKTAQDHGGDGVRLDVTVGLDTPVAGPARLTASVADATTVESVDLERGESEHTVTLTVTDPDLWWPNGYGDQPLYDLDVSVAPIDPGTGSGGPDSTGTDSLASMDARSDQTTTRVGFRDLELVRESDEDGDGESFAFEVNGVPVYAKGANWIPVDALYGGVTDERYENLIDSAVAANMNMLRVWGGGYYEHDAFYDYCDEQGILVWQDFMFSCALYPGDEAFLESVEAEVTDQVRRLADHPSIALWCGNNEVEMGIESWFTEADALEQLTSDYETLFYDVIGETVRAEDPTRTYWPGSPSSGTGMQDPYQENKGDIHYWDVWHSGAPFEDYESVEPRFVSEFGYQSFPSVALLSDVLPADQLNPTAPLMEHHQRNPGGNKRILQRMADHFRMPADFEHFVYLSQLQQSLAMQTAIEHWRRRKPTCMGTLYWQLNDLWPCASWSSIEYGGDWKALQHVARRIYAPVLLSTRVTERPVADERENGHDDEETEPDTLEVWLTSDEIDPVEGTVHVEICTFDGTPVGRTEQSVTLPSLASECVFEVDLTEFLDGRELDEVYLRARLVGGPVTSPAFEFFEPFKHLDLPETTVETTVESDQVTIESDNAALFVALSVPLDGEFSDNYFHMVPGEQRTLQFESDLPDDQIEESLERDLAVTHLGAASRNADQERIDPVAQ